MRPNNYSALITGSTSGIGLAMARAMAKEGANVVLNGFGDASEIEKTGNTGSFPHATIISGFGECVAGLEGFELTNAKSEMHCRYPAELTTEAIPVLTKQHLHVLLSTPGGGART